MAADEHIVLIHTKAPYKLPVMSIEGQNQHILVPKNRADQIGRRSGKQILAQPKRDEELHYNNRMSCLLFFFSKNVAPSLRVFKLWWGCCLLKGCRRDS